MREGSPDEKFNNFKSYRDRPDMAWPGGRNVAVWVSPNLENDEIDPPANPRCKSWTKPHPDVVGYSDPGHSDNHSGRIVEGWTAHE